VNRLTTPNVDAVQPAASLVDLVLAKSFKDDTASMDNSLHRPDSRDKYDIAWDQFGLDGDLSPALAVI
jgi:hypothetical protein